VAFSSPASRSGASGRSRISLGGKNEAPRRKRSITIAIELVNMAQVESWLSRLRKDGRTVDFVHGFVTGLVCASPIIGEPWDELLLCALLDEPYAPELPPGIVRADLIQTLKDIYASIEDELEESAFRPYIDGRFRNRIKADTRCGEWCLGVSRTFLLYSDEIRADEGLKLVLMPFFVLCEEEGSEGILAEEAPEDQAKAIELARNTLIPGVSELYSFIDLSFGREEEDEEDEG
jgi:hypothetical protein